MKILKLSAAPKDRVYVLCFSPLNMLAISSSYLCVFWNPFMYATFLSLSIPYSCWKNPEYRYVYYVLVLMHYNSFNMSYRV